MEGKKEDGRVHRKEDRMWRGQNRRRKSRVEAESSFGCASPQGVALIVSDRF